MKILRVGVAVIVAALSVGLSGCSPGESQESAEAQTAVTVSAVGANGKAEKPSPDFLKAPIVVGEYSDTDYSLDIPVVCEEIPTKFLERVLDSRLYREPSGKDEALRSSICVFRDKAPEEIRSAYEYYVVMDMGYKEGISEDGETVYEGVSERYPTIYAHHFPESANGCTASIHTTRGALRLSYVPGLGHQSWPPQHQEECSQAVKTLEKLVYELGG